MAENTKIEWTDATWNPITGCTLVSEGCRHCYAAQLAATRLKNHPSRQGLARINAAGEAKFTGKVRFNEQWLDQPLRWRRPRMIFVCAHSDLFHESVPDEWIDRVFAVMALAPQHTFQVLTKRPERAREYLSHMERCFHASPEAFDNAWGQTGIDIAGAGASDFIMDRPWPLPNVWLGTSVEDQATANTRIPHLLATPAAVRFVSAEPLLGPVDLTTIRVRMPGGQHSLWNALHRRDPGESALDWVIVGGESGKQARPMHPDWARSLRDQCQAAGVAFLFKQWGEWLPWEVGAAPMWNAQNCASEDGNWLFPSDMDADPKWDDGLAHYDPGETDHCAFQCVGKKAAGRLLDGREWNEMPGRAS